MERAGGRLNLLRQSETVRLTDAGLGMRQQCSSGNELRQLLHHPVYSNVCYKAREFQDILNCNIYSCFIQLHLNMSSKKKTQLS